MASPPLTFLYNQTPTKADFKIYTHFSNSHWGPESEDPQSVKDHFFDMDKSAVLGEIGGKLISLLYIHYRHSTFNNQPVYFAGIGGVVTHIRYRRQGIATKLLQYTNKLLTKQNVDFSLLTTDISRLGSIYEKAGYKPLGKPYIFITKQGKKAVDTNGMIRTIKNPKLVDLILGSKHPLNVGKSNF
jgi:predicted acetyltransferase